MIECGELLGRVVAVAVLVMEGTVVLAQDVNAVVLVVRTVQIVGDVVEMG